MRADGKPRALLYLTDGLQQQILHPGQEDGIRLDVNAGGRSRGQEVLGLGLGSRSARDGMPSLSAWRRFFRVSRRCFRRLFAHGSGLFNFLGG